MINPSDRVWFLVTSYSRLANCRKRSRRWRPISSCARWETRPVQLAGNPRLRPMTRTVHGPMSRAASTQRPTRKYVVCDSLSFYQCELWLQFGLAVWCSGNALVSINAVALHRARLVLGWVTAFGQVNCLIT